MMHVHLNGRLLPESRALVRATDKAVLYGFGLFEVLRAYRGAPFRLDGHLARLRRSAARFALPVPRLDFARAIRALCARNRLDDAYVRITLTEGGALLILATPLPPRPASGRVRIAPWVHDPRAPLHGHKTLNYLENYLVRNETRAAGFAETLFTDPRGRILEGTVTNLFLVKNGALVTPGLDGILPGITRQVVVELASRLGLPVRTRPVRARDLLAADEVFLTNALIEVFPVTALDRSRIPGPGPITRLLSRAYRALVLHECVPE